MLQHWKRFLFSLLILFFGSHAAAADCWSYLNYGNLTIIEKSNRNQITKFFDKKVRVHLGFSKRNYEPSGLESVHERLYLPNEFNEREIRLMLSEKRGPFIVETSNGIPQSVFIGKQTHVGRISRYQEGYIFSGESQSLDLSRMLNRNIVEFVFVEVLE